MGIINRANKDGFGPANVLTISHVGGSTRLLAFSRMRKAPRAVETRLWVWKSATATLCAPGYGHSTPNIGMGVGGGVTPASHAFEQREADHFLSVVAIRARAV